MGEPAVEVKTKEGAPEAKKVKLEAADTEDQEEGAPVAKKVKLEAADTEAPEAKKVKLEAADTEAPEAKKVKLEQVDTSSPEKKNGCETTAEERGVPGLELEIVRQIEYYFGDTNLPKDKFLLEQIKLEDGWIPIDVLLRFQRLAGLSKKPETIIASLRNGSKLMEINEDGTKIRRSPNRPLPERNEGWQKQVDERTVYCKGFPQDEDTYGPYIEFFKAYGPVDHINLRRYLDKQTSKWTFKGSAYVLFETKELASKFLELESVQYKGKELLRMTHEAHVSEKKKEKDERWGKKVKKTNPKPEESKSKTELAKACILKIADIKNEELSREEIKSALVDLGADVAYIEYARGEKEALVRLRAKEDGAATQFLEKLDKNVVKIGEEELNVSVLEGDEENAFIEKTKQSFQRQQKGHKGKKQGWKGGFKGHRRGRSPAKDGSGVKKEATA